jgi:hypothetical protein
MVVSDRVDTPCDGGLRREWIQRAKGEMEMDMRPCLPPSRMQPLCPGHTARCWPLGEAQWHSVRCLSLIPVDNEADLQVVG